MENLNLKKRGVLCSGIKYSLNSNLSITFNFNVKIKGEKVQMTFWKEIKITEIRLAGFFLIPIQ